MVEVKHHVVPYDKGFEPNTCNLLDIVDVNMEISSILFKESLIEHVPKFLCLFSKLITCNNKSRRTKCYSLVHNVVPTFGINISWMNCDPLRLGVECVPLYTY